MTRLIKKYKNRRLYDMEISQYITVETIHQYVINNISFRVEDSTTNKDITNSTLLQILVEMEESNTQFLSTDMLKQIILFKEHPFSQSMKKMLEDFFKNVNNMGNPSELLNFEKTTEQWQEKMQDWLKQWQVFGK